MTPGPIGRFLRRLVFVSALAHSAVPAQAQTLSIQGDRFAVDGVPRFLTFITYFGGMGAPNVAADLHLIRSLGFDGIRIWPNLDTGPQLMNGDGTLRSSELNRLLFILDRARQEHLVVDVTFTYEHIDRMTPATARVGILAATDALRSYDNLLFDIENERNVRDRRFMSEADVASIFAGIKAIHPARIAFASNAPVDDARYAADFTARLGLDLTAYHEPRPANWFELDVIQSIVGTLRSNGRPAYLQEPNTTRDSLFLYPSNDRAEFFQQAITHAKLTGAAAWCFHTEVGVDFRDGPPLFEDRLRAHPEPEWAFVNWLIPQVSLQTSNGVNFVVAEGGGGGDAHADRTSAGAWETFRVSVLTGGPPLSGDRVAFKTADGVHYLQAVGGGGAALGAAGAAVGAWETFILDKPGGGAVRHGDAIALRANDTPWYVTAESGGGRNVNVNRAARGPWEMFTILFR